MGIKTNKKIRQIEGRSVHDMGNIFGLVYSEQAGSLKTSMIGYHLIPLSDNAGGFTTNATTARPIKKGAILAIYNNGSSVRSLTFGTAPTVTALGPGVTDSSGNVGYVCAPNSWSYFASYNNNWVITNHADLIVYEISDDSYMIVND